MVCKMWAQMWVGMKESSRAIIVLACDSEVKSCQLVSHHERNQNRTDEFSASHSALTSFSCMFRIKTWNIMLRAGTRKIVCIVRIM